MVVAGPSYGIADKVIAKVHLVVLHWLWLRWGSFTTTRRSTTAGCTASAWLKVLVNFSCSSLHEFSSVELVHFILPFMYCEQRYTWTVKGPLSFSIYEKTGSSREVVVPISLIPIELLKFLKNRLLSKMERRRNQRWKSKEIYQNALPLTEDLSVFSLKIDGRL